MKLGRDWMRREFASWDTIIDDDWSSSERVWNHFGDVNFRDFRAGFYLVKPRNTGNQEPWNMVILPWPYFHQQKWRLKLLNLMAPTRGLRFIEVSHRIKTSAKGGMGNPWRHSSTVPCCWYLLVTSPRLSIHIYGWIAGIWARLSAWMKIFELERRDHFPPVSNWLHGIVDATDPLVFPRQTEATHEAKSLSLRVGLHDIWNAFILQNPKNLQMRGSPSHFGSHLAYFSITCAHCSFVDNRCLGILVYQIGR